VLIATPKIEIGYELSSEPLVITREMMARYSDWWSIHVDDQAAKRLGWPGVVVEGKQLYSIVSEMLASFFREGWLRGGKLSMIFLSPVWPNDTVTAKGVVEKRIMEKDLVRLQFRVWVENQWRAKVAMGIGSGVVP
jgi:acyl dehydratase